VVELAGTDLAWLAHIAPELIATDPSQALPSELDGGYAFEHALIRDGTFLIATLMLSHAAVCLGDAVRARQVYDLLLPFAARHVVAASAAGYFGSVEQPLGLSARAFGDEDRAKQHFERAQIEYRRIGAGPFVEQVEQLLAGSAPSTPEPDSLAEPTTSTFFRQGDVWTVAFSGRTVRMRDAKGMRYLSCLLSDPGRELHAIDLVATVAGAGEGERKEIENDAASDAGAMLDPRAKAEYRSRLEDLRSELDEAESNGDIGRAELFKDEIDAIAQELARAVGLGGRDRRSSAGAEKARVNVTRAVRAAIKRLTEEHPELAAHLAATVHTGTFCQYSPDPRTPQKWN
jgi:hypothetical protein